MQPTLKKWETEDGLIVTTIRIGSMVAEIEVISPIGGCGERFQVHNAAFWENRSESQFEQEMIERVRFKRDAWKKAVQIRQLFD